MHATSRGLTLRASTCCGTIASCVVPRPSWPFWLRPNAYRSPQSVTARVCVSPHAIFTMLQLLRAEMVCGMKTSLQSPCPSRPKSPLQSHEHSSSMFWSQALGTTPLGCNACSQSIHQQPWLHQAAALTSPSCRPHSWLLTVPQSTLLHCRLLSTGMSAGGIWPEVLVSPLRLHVPAAHPLLAPKRARCHCLPLHSRCQALVLDPAGQTVQKLPSVSA